MLNAFRHQRSIQCNSLSKFFRCNACSTPFGIKDQFSILSSKSSRRLSSAQRLSASKINSVNFWAGRGTKIECSTPFGIKDQFSSIEYLLHFVSASAQRLSASKINSAIILGRQGLQPRCSTPFGIKDQFSLLAVSHKYYYDWVLNAFRHQRSIQHTAPKLS